MSAENLAEESGQNHYATASALCAEGVKYYQAGCRADAVRLWHQALEVMPDFSAAIMNLGGVYKDQGDLEQAAEYFLKALAIHPDFLEANFNLAVTCHLQGNFEAALAYYLEVIRIKPDFADAHTNLDVLLCENIQDPNLVQACFQRIRDVNPLIYELGPRRIRIETSSACNLRCQHCPTGTNYHGAERNIMTMERYDAILRQLQPMPLLRDVIFYLAGEPLLNKHLPVMCRRIKEETHVTQTQFNTNGMLVTEEICRQLVDANVDKIQVSVDGASPEENDEIRRGSRYTTIVENVHMLARHLSHTQVGIANTIIKRSGDPIEPVTPEYLMRDFPGIPIWTTYAMKWPSLDMEKSALAQTGCESGLQADNFCKMPFTEMAIRPNGDVVMCCYDLAGEMVMGNIQHTELLDIWQSPLYQQIRSNMLSREISLLPDVCKRCQHYCGATPLIRR